MMPDLAGYVSVKNKCGSTIKDVSLSLVVDGNARVVVQDPFLSDGLTSLNKKYAFPGGSATEWRVAFTLNGKPMTGTANCQLTTADNNQTLKIALSADSFTLSPLGSERVTGLYDGQDG